MLRTSQIPHLPQEPAHEHSLAPDTHVTQDLCSYCTTILDAIEFTIATGEIVDVENRLALDWNSEYRWDLRDKRPWGKEVAVLRDTYPWFQAMRGRAREGCALCGVLWDALRRGVRADGDGDAEEQVGISVVWETDMRVPRQKEDGFAYMLLNEEHKAVLSGLGVVVKGSGWRESGFVGVCADGEGNVARYLNVRHRPRVKHALAAEGVALMKRWINEAGTVRLGEKSSERSWERFPSRLVYVGELDKDAAASGIRLFEVSDMSSIGTASIDMPAYVALSYCWGRKGNPLQTTKKSRAPFKTGIEWSAIPKTVRDAILVARALRIEYLWIDALCITQDDGMDVAMEMQKMGLIYENAYVTIVAACANDPEEGFLRMYEEVENRAVIFHSKKHPQLRGPLRFFYQETRPMLGEDYLREVEDSVWNTRAWTLQERHLSRRVLFFGCTSLHFSSNNKLRSDSHSLEFTSKGWFITRFLSNLTSAFAKETDLIPAKLAYDEWYIMMAQFSARQIKFMHDRLPAIDGVAKNFGGRLSAMGRADMYLTGLWRADLARGLMWSSCGGPDDSGIYTYTAPSWSWIGRQFMVTWDIEYARDMTLNALSEVGCRVVKTMFQQEEQLGKFSYVRCSCIHLEGRVAMLENPHADLDDWDGDRISIDNVRISLRLDAEDLRRVKTYLLILLSEYKNKEEGIGCGLVMRNSSTIGHFERIGTFTCYYERPRGDGDGVILDRRKIREWLRGWAVETLALD